MELVREHCYWPGMCSDIQQWVRECEQCQVAKDPRPVPHSFMGHLLASRPNEVVAPDFTVLEPCSEGWENILVMTDVFSKYTVAIPIRDQCASTVAWVLLNVFLRLVYQVVFTLTRATVLRVLWSASFVVCIGLKWFNRTLHHLLRTMPTTQKRSWASCLPQVLFCYNSTPHQVTGECPFFLMFGCEPRLPIDLQLGRVQDPEPGNV